MWGNNFYKAGTHQQSSPCNEGHPIPISGPRAYLNSPSYAAQRAHPPPAGVLSADLARPISVRELAQSRVPAVPPPPPAIQTAQTRATTTGFAGFGVPTSPVVYAATSGVSTSQSLSTHADAGDFTSLAHRDIDHLSSHELYDYASHLQESSKRCSGYLSEAYAKRDQYRGEVAHLKEELHRMYMQMDVLRREQERASETLLNLREDNTQLRQKLAEAEGKACQMQAKMSVLSGADPSIALHFYQSQLALKEAQLRELQQEHEKATAASLQRRSCSTTAAEHDRRSGNISGEGAAAPHTSPPSDLRSKGELQDGAEAASADLHTALGELQCLNTSLSHRLEEAHTSHKAALAAHAEESAAATADRAVLLDTIAQLRQQCADMQSTEDQLVAALTQRAPISKKEYSALQASYDDLTAALAKAEAQVAALQEKEKHYHQSAQQAQEELHESLTTGLEERQVMQARNEQMQSLVNHLQRELELAERANQLRQEQLDAAISGNQQLAENFHTAQEQLLSASAELQDLCDTRERLESQLRELQQRMQELEQGDPHQRRPYRDEETDSALPHTSPASTESAVAHQRQELEAELETLRSQRDALVCDRDGIIGEVRRLQEERLALLRSPRPQVEAHTQTPSSAVEALLEDRADDDLPQQEELSALEAAHHCIEKMKHTIEALQAERVRVETDLTTEVNTLEAELTSQPRALAEAEVTAAAQNAHLDEIMMALRDELVATQAQKKRLRASEETHRERYAEQQRVVEQLPAHVRELEMAARHAEGSLPIVPSAQPATVSDSQQSIVDAALESLARQLEDAQHRFDELTAEHARTVEELARATRAVAELEARAADVESKRETTHAAAESAEAGLAARVAELTKENAQLKEKLSTSRAAVTTFASRQTDGESASASLEERCAAEVRRTEIAEAEVSALREALSRTAAELAEVLQRSEDVQATLERTVARLGEQESLVEQLNHDASELNEARLVLLDEVTQLKKALAEVVTEKADVLGQLLATQKELDRAAEVQDAQCREEERLQDALSTAMAAFERQTQYVRLGMAHVVDMSRAFCRVAEEAVRLSSAQTNNASGTGTSVREILSPWTLALQWVSAMEQRLEALDIGGTPNSVSDAEGQGERRRRRRRSRTTEAKEDDGEEVGEGSGADAPSVSLCLAVPASRAEAAFSRLIDDQGVATKTIGDLRCALAGKELDLANLRSAMDALAKDLMNERDRADNLSAAIDDASEKIASAQAEFEEQLRQRTAATTAEVVEARRAEARATAAQVRAEKQLAAVENDLKEQDALLRRLQDENHRLTREADQLLRSLRLEGNLRISRNASGSVTPKSVSLPAKSAEDAVQLFTTASSTVEAVEQAQILQVSSLQADLMLTRRQARELEGRETTLRQACAAQEQQLNELRVQAAEAEHLREDLATLRADYAGLEQRYNDLERMSTAVGGGAMQELKQLRQQLKVREAELEELKARMRDLMLSKAAPELEAARRQEALRESLSGITTQLAATQAQYGGGTDSSNKARSRRTSLAAAPSNADFFPSLRPSPQDVLTSRIEHLETLVHDREVALEKVQAAQLASRAAMDTLEDQLATKTAALERAESLVAEYEDTIDKLTRDAVVRCSNRNTVPTTAPPLSSALDIHDAEALSASVPPLTPLTPRTRAAINRQPHAAISMASPAPRMPNLEEVADDKDDSEEGKHVDSVGSSSRAAPSSVTDGEARASGSRRRATSLTAHRSSPSTKRNVSSSLSNAPGRKSLSGSSAPAPTRKRARSSINA